MCGALKNVYALYAGFLQLEPGSSRHEMYLSEVAEEMKALLSANGADKNTVNLSCGVGDLRLTCAYPSRNYEFGRILARDLKARPEKTVEGLTTLAKIKRGEIKIPDTALKLKELLTLSSDWSLWA